VAKGDVVLVTVITDGYENASREYNGTAIKSLVETLKKEGWVFTYIGANQDVEAVAASMSIDNHLAFDADEASTCAMFEHEKRSRRKFFSKISRSMSMRDLNTGYFDDDEEDAADKGKS
ncbi:MAG: VWA domain-containing protein, partial [Muribaculaceae bacterium]|nr:VWA domain-containing protein [Muribaculaceae bacterium]